MTALSQAYGVIAEAMYEDRVTFKRPSATTDTVGGSTRVFAETDPDDIPCRYRPASGSEIQRANQVLSKTAYSIFVPATYENELVDVDARCQAVIAAREDGEVTRTFNVVAPLRNLGIEIEVLVTIES